MSEIKTNMVGMQLHMGDDPLIDLKVTDGQLPMCELIDESLAERGFSFPDTPRIPSMTLEFTCTFDISHWPEPVPMTRRENLRIAWGYLKLDLVTLWEDLRFLLRAIVERA